MKGEKQQAMEVIIIIILILYGSELIMNPQKHKGELTILTILAAVFYGFYDASGAKKEWDRRKRG